MAVPQEQAETAAFLRQLSGSDPVETHISLVFVGAEQVWKLKKAVRLAFLDFQPLDERRRFAQRELELNKPAAPGLYRDVVPVVRDANGGLTLAPSGATDRPVVDWVLRMARVPAEDFFDSIAGSGGLTPTLLDALGDTVAAYHQTLPATSGVDAAAAMRTVSRGNAQSALDAGLAVERVEAWLAAILTGIDDIADWLAARSRDGFVRRAHGDLHLGNLCLWQGKPVPFDALEFDEAMATIDLGYDLAFLLMDLDLRVDRAAANRVMNRYVARTGDAALTRGLAVFLSLRAMVRAHVEAKRGRDAPAARYLNAAMAYLSPRPAVIAAIGGLQGTGKSTLARLLAPAIGNAPGALVLRSDEIRKRLHNVGPEERLPATAYSEASSEAVLAALAETARLTACNGQAAMADATFLDPMHRALIRDAAIAACVPFIGLWLDAPLAILEARVAARTGDASDATVAVLRAASRDLHPPSDWVSIDATDLVTAQLAAETALRRYRAP